MTDLPKRLRRLYVQDGTNYVQEAADEIERLRAEVEALRAERDAMTNVLPGVYYMDPPDGGDVSLLKQLQRMSNDAARYRLLRRKFAIISDGEGNAEFCPINLPRPTYIAPNTAIELDTALDRERLGLDGTRPPTPVGWSDTDWIKHLQEQAEQPHPLAGQHINQGSMDAAADAYEAEYYDALKRDAQRYRWLRGDLCPDHSVRWTQWEVRCWKAPSWTGDLRRADLDDAIDAAIRRLRAQADAQPTPAAPQAEPCIGNDPICPCQDGDACHYKDAADGTKAWPVPQAEPKLGELMREQRNSRIVAGAYPDGNPNAGAMMAQTRQAEPKRGLTCLWSRADDDTDMWETSCGHAFTIIDGTPSDNHMGFCCYCGRRVDEEIGGSDAE